MVLAKNRSEYRVAWSIRSWRLWFSTATIQKGMLRPQPFSRRKPEVLVASLAISVVPARTLGSPTAGIGTELLAHREKIEVTRSGAPFERSPVPMSRPHRHHTRAVAHFPGECLKPETRWRREVDSNSRYRFLN
jgi:hypothetical protein